MASLCCWHQPIRRGEKTEIATLLNRERLLLYNPPTLYVSKNQERNRVMSAT